MIALANTVYCSLAKIDCLNLKSLSALASSGRKRVTDGNQVFANRTQLAIARHMPRSDYSSSRRKCCSTALRSPVAMAS